MAAYYYLIPQLPSLSYNAPLPMTSQAFLDLCKKELSSSDTPLLDLCALDPDTRQGEVPAYAESAPASSSGFVDAWRAWERALRLNLARYRSQKLKREGGIVEPPAYPADAAAAAKAAVAIESPLEAELFLDQARWNAIEAIQGLTYFGENAVYAYLLKLRLLERKALFKAEEGFAEYKMLYAAI
ncbi:MAG: DUF2764 domain-containing protein, partial [Treponema sp.]|nr:DUF2764 domain-containing protein [Treponema sp.]